MLAVACGCGDDNGASSAASTSSTGASIGPGAGSIGNTGTTDAPTGTGDAPTTSSGPDGGESSGGATTSGTTGADACADSVLTWENFGEPFMLSWCTGCHHSALPSSERACAPCYVNFDQHAGVHPLAAYIELRVIDWAAHEGTKPMPPAAIVPDDELMLLREYLECGAPGPEVGAPAPTCPDPDTVVPGCE